MTILKSVAALLTVALLAACAGPSKSTVDENAAHLQARRRAVPSPPA